MSGQRYTLAEAQRLLPEARARVAETTAIVAELQGLLVQLRSGDRSASAVDRVSALEAEVDTAMAWFETNGVQIKSLTPALLDFPARAIRDGDAIDVLLCWRDDEETIAYYHPPETGYRTREPVAFLDRV